MEFCNRGSLYSFIHKGIHARDELILLDIAIQIADGMHFLHSRRPKVMHRDLKPSNVLLHEPRKGVLIAKIADFGTIAFGKQTQYAGTSVYIAPEVTVDAEREYDYKVDVYSFGMVLYEMFTQIVPYSNMGVDPKKMEDGFNLLQEYLYNDVRPMFPSSKALHSDLKELIKQCWQTESQSRPEFAAIKSVLEEIKSKVEVQEKRIKNYGSVNLLHEEGHV